MQEPTKPAILSELPQDIQDLNNIPLQINEFQEGYKEKVGLSGQANNGLPFHPKALEVELQDMREHFDNLERNRFNTQWKEKFLQYMFQEPPLQISADDLQDQEKIKKALQTKLEEKQIKIDDIKREVKYLTENIEKARSKSSTRVDIGVKVLEDISSMENELTRIQLLLATKSDLTLDKAKEILAKQQKAMEDYNTSIDKKTEKVQELQWKVEDLEEKVDKLRKTADAKTAEAEKAVRLNEERDKNVEKEFFKYKEATAMCNQMFGVESIIEESSSLVHVTYAKPLHAILSIHIDEEARHISNATLIGSHLKVNGLLKLARRTNLKDGMRMLIVEVLARLKKQQKQQQQQ